MTNDGGRGAAHFPSSSTAASIASLLEKGRDNEVAVISAENSRSLTFGRLRDRVEYLAGRMVAAGVRRGDRVALVLPNGFDFVQCLLAIFHVGAAAAPLNPAYTRAEYAFYLGDLAPQLLLLPESQVALAREALSQNVPIGDVVDDDKHGLRIDSRGMTKGSRVSLIEEVSAEDNALLLHTSGTTSRPKLVPLRHRNLVASAHSIASHYQLSDTDVSYCAMPLFHVHGLLASVLAPLAAGGRVVIPGRRSASTFWKSISRDHVTWYSAAPSLHHMLLDKRPKRARTSVPLNVRFVRSCSSPLSVELYERIEEEFEAPVVEAYGMTEASHQISSNPLPPHPRFPLSVGVATGTDVTILGADGVVTDSDLAGEIAVRGATVMTGYLNNAEADADAFQDGWFRTGDWGTIDRRGFIWLKGRIKEIIIRGGENISPNEVEAVLLRHPAVADAACFAVPDSKYGESVGAGVVLEKIVSAEDLLEHCRNLLASYKIPTMLHFLESIPRTATGKIQRREVAATLLKGTSH